MLTTNDIAAIQRLIAGNYTETYVDTTDDTPVTAWSYELTASELITIEVICRAMKDTSAGFVSRLAKNFFYNGATLTDTGAFWGYITKEYVGTGLSTCDFDFVVSGNKIQIVWTGEAGASIRANFKILVHQTVNLNLT